MTKRTTENRLLSTMYLSLMVLTLTACPLVTIKDDPYDRTPKEKATDNAAFRADETATAAWPEEQATLISEVATHEAKATGTAEAEAEAIATSNEEQLVDELVSEESAEESAPIKGCDAPGEQCVVEARFDFGSAYPEDFFERNAANLSFPVDGGDVTGNFHLERMVEHRWEDGYCLEVYRYHGTLSGHYDPVSRKLKGPVHGPSTSWEELEGCENYETESIGGDAISWWATYDPTTGELQGIVEWETEDPEDAEWPFHN
jgi:hypothetical protein